MITDVRVALNKEIQDRIALAEIDAEIGIVDEVVRTNPKEFTMFWNVLKAIRSGQACKCPTVGAYYSPFPNMPPGLPSICAKCFGDVSAPPRGREAQR